MAKYLDSSGLTLVWQKLKQKLITKQDVLISGTNIRTINNQSLLGSGNIVISVDDTNYVHKTGDSMSGSLTISNEDDTNVGLRVENGASLVAINDGCVTTQGICIDGGGMISSPDATDDWDWISSHSGNDRITLADTLATKASDASVVHLSGSETISGTKTFTNTLTASNGIMVSSNGIYVSLGGLNVANGGTVTNSLSVSGTDWSGIRNSSSKNLQQTIDSKQDTLIGEGTGQNIKTINGYNLLGSGNIYIQGGGGDYFPGDGISIDQTNHVISVDDTIPGDKIFPDSICIGDPDDVSENFVGIAPGTIYAPATGINAASIRVHSIQPFDNVIDIRNGAEFTLYQALAQKQNTLTAGSGININSSNSTISLDTRVLGSQTVTSVSNISPNYRETHAIITNSGILSFSAQPQEGYPVEIYIDHVVEGQAHELDYISISLPNSGNYKCVCPNVIQILEGEFAKVTARTFSGITYVDAQTFYYIDVETIIQPSQTYNGVYLSGDGRYLGCSSSHGVISTSSFDEAMSNPDYLLNIEFTQMDGNWTRAYVRSATYTNYGLTTTPNWGTNATALYFGAQGYMQTGNQTDGSRRIYFDSATSLAVSSKQAPGTTVWKIEIPSKKAK